MDFNKLLSVANNNEIEAKYEASKKRYSTSFAPPKKQPKSSVQSDQIKHFLAKKAQEERRKAIEEQKKKEQLLALRAQSTKNNKKAKIMASRTKDNDFSRIKLTDDELEAKKKREKELQALELRNKRERMMARIELEEKEKLLPRKRKRKNKDQNQESQEHIDECPSDDESNKKTSISEKMQPKEPKKIPKRPPPPPVDFNDLLKVAAVKQFQPLELKPVEKKEERPLTKKAKRALQEEEERLRRKKAAAAAKSNPDINYRPNGTSTKTNNLNYSSTSSLHFNKVTTNKTTKQPPTVIQLQKANDNRSPSKQFSNKPSSDGSFPNRNNSKLDSQNKNTKQNSTSNHPLKMTSSNTIKKGISGARRDDQHTNENRPMSSNHPQINKSSPSLKKPLPSVKLKDDINFLNPTPKIDHTKKTLNKTVPYSNNSVSSHPNNSVTEKKSMSLTDDMYAEIERRIREDLEKKVTEKLQKQFAEKFKNLPSTSSMPSNRTDIRMSQKNHNTMQNKLPAQKPNLKKESSSLPKRPFHPNPYLLPPRRLLESSKSLPKPTKRRIESDDDDEEDEEMDDFIDNSCTESEDYSKYIREIFNYDKSRYDDDDDDDIQEASFGQVDAEERKSAIIAYKEDLEEERLQREKSKRMRKKQK